MLYTVVTGGPVHSLRVAAAAASINSVTAKQWFAAANKHLAVTPLLLPLQKLMTGRFATAKSNLQQHTQKSNF